MEDLARHRHRDLGEPHAERIPDPTVEGAPMEMRVVDEIHYTDHGRSYLTVRGEDEVLVAQGIGAPDLGGFLAEQRGIDGELALALQRGALQVHLPGDGHGPIDGPEVLLLQVKGLPGLLVDHGAARVQDPDGASRRGGGLLHRLLLEACGKDIARYVERTG